MFKNYVLEKIRIFIISHFYNHTFGLKKITEMHILNVHISFKFWLKYNIFARYLTENKTTMQND